MRRLLLAVAVSVASAALLTAQPATESPAAAAARKRQETIKSVEFVFLVKEITEPGALSSLGMVNAVAGKPFPAQQTTAEAENRLVFDGEKVRYDNNLPNFDGRTGGLSTTIGRSASDGTTGRQYVVPREGRSRPASFGVLEHARSVMTWRSTLLLPVFFWCRANDFTHAPFDIASDFAPTAARTPFKGLLLTEYQGKGSALKYRLQVEDAEGYLVRRVRASGANGPTLSLDIEYAVDAASGLRAPSEWTQTLYTDSGKVRRTTTFKVKSVRVNPRLAPDEFDLPFPAGIDVRDNRSDQFYLVRDDGSLQKIRNWGDSGPDTLAEASRGWSRRNLWVILAVAVSSLSLLALVFARRRKGSVSAPSLPTQGVE